MVCSSFGGRGSLLLFCFSLVMLNFAVICDGVVGLDCLLLIHELGSSIGFSLSEISEEIGACDCSLGMSNVQVLKAKN